MLSLKSVLLFAVVASGLSTVTCAHSQSVRREPSSAPAIDRLAADDSEGFTVIAIPDSQVVMDKAPHIWLKQTAWIAENAKDLNVKIVVHEGDITDHNTLREWEDARKGFQQMFDAKVPFTMTVGNHDLPDYANTTRDTKLFNKMVKAGGFRKVSTFGGVYDREPNKYDNNYHVFTAGGVKWLVVSLEFGPRQAVLDWANQVIRDHADHRVIIVTHCYLSPDNNRNSHKVEGIPSEHNPHKYGLSKNSDVNDGEEIWEKLASKHANISFVLSGHLLRDGAGYRADKGDHGNTVHQILANYQYDQENQPGGNGFMRIMQFYPHKNLVKVVTYSPQTGTMMTTNSDQNHFYLENIDLGAPQGGSGAKAGL